MTDPTDPTEAQGPPPSPFDEWVDYCFVHGADDFRSTGDCEERDERQRRFLTLNPETLATFLTRLFESPALLADKYTDDQIAKATWFLFGIASDYLGSVQRSRVDPSLQSRCIRSVATMYTDLFDRVCGKRGTDPDTDLCDEVALDMAVYMIWDMDGLELSVMFTDDKPHLREAGIDVLQSILTRCRTSACLKSALHGISHIHVVAYGEGEHELCQRLARIVDEFLASRPLPDWLRAYAAAAMRCLVQ